MTASGMITYLGRLENGTICGQAISDATSGQQLVTALRSARGALIADPLSFPWELTSLNDTTPLVVDIAACSDDDLTALLPVLRCLTTADAIFGDPAVVAQLCTEIGLPDLWQPREIDIDAFTTRAAWSKRADVEERRIIERLQSNPLVTVSVIGGAHLRSTGFATIVREILGDDGQSYVDAIWGIHPYPGRPVDRAVVAVRRRNT